MAKQKSGLRRVFVDTSAFFAILNAKDNNHTHAISIMKQLSTQPTQLFTTNFILAETHALLLKKLGYKLALQFLDNITASTTTIIRVSAVDEQRATTIIRQYDDKEFSLTDGTSFAVIERTRVSGAFSFDQNFSQYGLNILTADS